MDMVEPVISAFRSLFAIVPFGVGSSATGEQN